MIDTELREVLHRQAAALRVPDAHPGERLIRLDDYRRAPRRGRTLAAAAAITALAGGGLWMLSERRDIPPPAAANQPANGFHFSTPTVSLDADSIEVIAGGRTWTPTSALIVAGDPGFDDYAELDLTWLDNGTEQRILFYFASDGVDWWASEIRTRDGSVPGDWFEPIATGEFMRTKRGAAFVGDLDLPNLRIRNLRLEAFRAPASCTNPTKPVALVLNFPTINAYMDAAGFGATTKLVDTATCTPLPIADYRVEYVSSDESVVTIASTEERPDYPPTLSRVELRLVAPGTATVQVTVRDAAGAVIDTGEMRVTVAAVPNGVTLDTIADTIADTVVDSTLSAGPPPTG